MSESVVEGLPAFAVVQGEHTIIVRAMDGADLVLEANDGPALGPVPRNRVLPAVAALICYLDDSLELEEADYETRGWDEGTVAAVVAESLDCESPGGSEFTVDGIVWQSSGSGRCRPLDLSESAVVIAEESWSLDDGGRSPGNSDDGTYYLLRIASRYEVFHQSEGETTYERSIEAPDVTAAVEQFRRGYGGS